MNRTVANIKRSAHLVLLTLLLLAVAPIRQPALQAAHQAPVVAAAQAQNDLCNQAVAVPASECAALIELYNSTGGANWLNRTGWLAIGSAASPCDWFGVVCVGGHVVELNLSRNRLSGPFPKSLGNLPALRGLALAGNYLQGVVPHGVCTLVGRLTTADLAYNALFTGRQDTTSQQETQACLDRLDPDWAETQTTRPHAFSATQIESNAVQLAWTPIQYTADGGYYEVFTSTDNKEYTSVGKTADKTAAGLTVSGLISGTTYFLHIEAVTPPHAGNPTEVRSDYARTIAVTRANESILVIVYFPADNDLSPQVPAVVERLRRGSQFNPNVRVVLLSDKNGLDEAGQPVEDTEVVTIANGAVIPTDAVFTRWGKRELDTANPEVLGWFLNYARETFPASREIVALMGHGLALAPEIEWVDTSQGMRTASAGSNRIPPLPIGLDPTPGDITDRGYMSTVDLGRALAAATDNGARPFDLLFLDQCFQGNLDTLYEIRTAADRFIASPNYAWLVAPYDEYLALLGPNNAGPTFITDKFAEAIIRRYQLGLNNRHPNVIFSVRRVEIEAVAAAVSTLGEALSRAVRAGERQAISDAADTSQYVDTTQCDDQEKMVLRSPDELIGVTSFAAKLNAAFPFGDAYGVHAATEEVRVALKPIHESMRVGQPYLAPSQTWGYTNTITILAPLPPATPAAVAWRSSVYTETMPLRATWTPVPTMTTQVTASFAYVRDGSWDEFLAGWYDAPLAPTVGEWCHYIAPAIVAADDLEPLTLEAAEAGEGAVQLTWSEPENDDAAGYWLYEWDLDKVSWIARQQLAFGQTSIVIPNLLPDGRYRFLLVAQDEAGQAVAQSNEVEWPASVYLPLVRS